VGEAGDGENAVTCARRLHPDVVLMDIRMPVLLDSQPLRLPRTRYSVVHHAISCGVGRRAGGAGDTSAVCDSDCDRPSAERAPVSVASSPGAAACWRGQKYRGQRYNRRAPSSKAVQMIEPAR
jgi:CheY-like chemotaxis protein